jgi:hypothetical protein
MGITFRSGNYIRHVHLGGRTIKDGEAAAVWNRRGEHTQIIGPRRIILFSSTIRFLTRFKAEADQYLKINHRDGTVEHIQGPIQMYLNPSHHDEITVKDGIKLKENEVIQVCHLPMLRRKEVEYNVDGTSVGKEVAPLTKESKRYVHGPTLFFPTEDELVEEFQWSGLPTVIDDGMHIYNLEGKPAAKFTTVQLHTKRVWRAKVTIGSESKKVLVSLAITYKIDSIDKITLHKDPCASVCAALMGDIQDLFQEEETAAASSSGNFQPIQAAVAWKLSGSKSFPNLMGMGEAVGFSIESVKVLEISPGKQLQRQINEEHDRKMQMKARVASKESEIQFQELELEERRKKMENKIQLSRKEAKMQSELAEELYLQKMAASDQQYELDKKREKQKLESWKASDEAVLYFLGNLKELGVDMSKFMCTDGGKKATTEILNRAPSLASSTKTNGKNESKQELEM